jgi:hypothetical protein
MTSTSTTNAIKIPRDPPRAGVTGFGVTASGVVAGCSEGALAVSGGVASAAMGVLAAPADLAAAAGVGAAAA